MTINKIQLCFNQHCEHLKKLENHWQRKNFTTLKLYFLVFKMFYKILPARAINN